jgi:Fe-S cluster assembly iron-binding protein IscA
MIEQMQQSAIGICVITMTPAAAAKVRELLKHENDPNLGLRIFVAGGGCSGLQYGMTLDEEQEGDTVVYVRQQEDGSVLCVARQEGVTFDPETDFKVFIDEMSLNHIVGSEIDYVDSLMGAGFSVNNPNAVSSCGCGHSFKTAENSGEARSCNCSH